MAITSYSELQTAVANWLERSGDTAVTDNVADFIALAEARLSRDLKNLRVAKSSTTLTGTASSRQLTLPTDYLSPLELYLTTYGTQIWLRPFVAGSVELGTSNSVPAAWSINGTQIDLDVPCDQAHTFLFWYRAKGLALATTTPNWLLTQHPDIYLYASIIEAATYLGNPDVVSAYETLLRPRLRDLKVSEAENVRVAPATVDPALLRSGAFSINTGD